MSVRWSFRKIGNGVYLQARAEGPGGLIGDASKDLEPGETFYGLPFDLLKKARAGVVIVGDDGKAKIVTGGAAS